VIDSGSTDGTAELARRYGASVHLIPRGEPGAFVQYAVPLDGRWLTTMVEEPEARGRGLRAPGPRPRLGWAPCQHFSGSSPVAVQHAVRAAA
jgi:glycosyltransferase involved in cell wall biosynthesis